jgi:MSHA pilin protein MshA
MKNQMNKQKGFTLIELIIVIVILGILAVTAAPRFIDLQEDARESALEGVKAALQGGSQLVYAKAAIAGVQRSSTAVDVVLSSGTIKTIFGYPSAEDVDEAAEVAKFMDLSAGDFTVAAGSATGTFTISLDGGGTTGNCWVLYTNATLAAAPTIAVDSGGC